MTKVGFIGLGIMGLPMAINLKNAGIELMVNDLNHQSVRQMTDLGALEGTKAQIGKECGIIFMILPNGMIVKDAVFGKDGIASAVKKGTVICDMSSVTPVQSKECYNRLEKMGVSFVDAPVSGGADPSKVYEAIRGGLAGSAVLDAKMPMILERNFNPGGKISINHKDIKNVVETAHEIDVPVPFTSQLFEIFQALKVAGHMNDDHAGIVQYFEKLAQTVVKSTTKEY